jgi:hypothetical protein
LGWRRKRLVEHVEVVLCEFDVQGGAVVLHVFGLRCPRNSDDTLLLEHPGQSDLCGAGAVLVGDSLQRGTAEQPTLLDGRVGHDGDASCCAPGQQIAFDATARQVIEDLVGLHGVSAGSLEQSLHVREVEITHAPVSDFSGPRQGLEGGYRFSERDLFAPMKEVEVKVVGPETAETALTRSDRAPAGRVVWQHLT